MKTIIVELNLVLCLRLRHRICDMFVLTPFETNGEMLNEYETIEPHGTEFEHRS